MLIIVLLRQKLGKFTEVSHKPAALRKRDTGRPCFYLLKFYWSAPLAVLKIASLLVISQFENYLGTKLLFSEPCLAAEGLGETGLSTPELTQPEEEVVPDQESSQVLSQVLE